MLVRATAGAAVGLVVMGLAPGLFVLLLGRIGFGLMAGTVPAANPLIAANTPPEYVSSAMGMLQSAIYVSNAIGPLLGGLLASTLGYRVTFLVTAALYLLSALPVLLLVRERFTPPVAQAALVPALRGNFRMVFQRSDLVLPMMGAFLAYAGISVMQPVLPLHVSQLVGGVNVERATGLATGMQGAAATVAAFMVGRVTRRIGFTPLLHWGPVLLIVAYLGLWLSDSFGILIALLCVIGVVQGLTVTSLTALIALRTPQVSAGAVFGVVSSLNSFAFSGAPFIGGLAGTAFGLRAAFPVCALISAGMFVFCLAAARQPHPSAATPAPTLPGEEAAP